MFTVLAGGVGAARLLSGLVQVCPPDQLTAVVNVADDVVLHGLHISPDLDTVTYTLAGEIDPERGWGLAGETWQAMGTLGRYGGPAWFNLGYGDLGTHMYRTHRLREGAALSEVTAEITAAWGIGVRLIPASDDPVRTMVTLADGGEIGFQEYFVQRQHSVEVSSLRFAGADESRPAPGVLEAIGAADSLVIAPSNPLVSIDPILAVGGLRAAVEARRDRCVAVSPIVAGAALKGPADRLMRELGHQSSVVGVAKIYVPLASTLIIDESDSDLAPQVDAAGMRCVVAPTVMSDPAAAAAWAEWYWGRSLHEPARGLRSRRDRRDLRGR